MDKKVKEEILELMDLILDRSDVKKSMKGKDIVGSNSDIDKELPNIKSDSVRKLLEEYKKESEKERVKLLCKKYGKILLKESLYNRVMGIK